jgi:hypothetical protein
MHLLGLSMGHCLSVDRHNMTGSCFAPALGDAVFDALKSHLCCVMGGLRLQLSVHSLMDSWAQNELELYK